MGPTASEKIGSFVESIRSESISPEVVHRVARAFVDTFAGAVAARDDPASRIIRRYAAAGGSGPSTLWATGDRVRQESAALANGVMGHVLDYDDVMNLPQHGHTSVVLLSALAPLAEAEGASGGRLSAAYAVGFEVIAKLPQNMVTDHYVRGWHSTSTIGIIGAAAACANLLGLDARRAAAAVGIAVAHTSGVLKSFGTMCKSIQPGNAAASAIRCARLAAAGFSAPRDALDGKLGFAEIYGKGEDLHPGFDTLGQEPLEVVRVGLGVKKYPCCYCTHRALQGILDLIAERPIPAPEVERIRIGVELTGLVPLIHHRPFLGLQGKFSMEYCMAAAILDGKVGLESFTDAAVQRPEAQELLRRVEVYEEGDPLPRRAVVEVELRSGERRSCRVEALRGGAQLPLTEAELEAKLRDCVAFAGLEMNVDGFLSEVWDWRDRPIREILAGVPAAGG